MATTHLPKRNMRNQPTKAICDFSHKLEVDFNVGDILLALTETNGEYSRWIQNVQKVAKQGKPFRIENTICDIHVIATGKRI